METEEKSNSQAHALVEFDRCFHLHCKKSLDAWVAMASGFREKIKRRLLRRMIRKIYDLTDEEFSGDFCLEERGTFTSREVARRLARERNLQAIAAKPGEPGFGFRWEVKESGVNVFLVDDTSVRFGLAEYTGTDIDAKLRARSPTNLVDAKKADAAVGATLHELKEEIDKTLAMARAVSSE